MRREPYSAGSYVHVVKRGTRGLPIVRDDRDRRRFILMLRHFNDQFCPDNWFKDLLEAGLVHSFERPPSWPPQKKLVEIICFCLMNNHFHLLLKEIIEGGITRFMKRLGVGMTNYFNEKYQEVGSLFQGSYKSRTIDDDIYFQYVSVYIQVKNCFELYPGGYQAASKNFNRVFEWAKNYPYCSLGEFMGICRKAITDPGLLSDVFTSRKYQAFCRDFITGRSGDVLKKSVAFE